MAQAPCESARICPADKPVVAFYFDSKQAISERDAMTQKYNRARLFKITYDIQRFFGMYRRDMERKGMLAKALTITEMETKPVQAYETTETPQTITGTEPASAVLDSKEQGITCNGWLGIMQKHGNPDWLKSKARDVVEICVRDGFLTRTQIQDGAFNNIVGNP